MNKIIIFDIDRTIFDTSNFGLKTEEKIARLMSVKTEEVTNTKNRYKARLKKDTDFLPQEMLAEISKAFNYPYEELLKAYFGDLENFNDSIYEDTSIVLETLRQRGYRIGIFSEGDEKFQKMKIMNHKISMCFDQDLIFISKRKLIREFLKTIPYGSTIVDDKLEVIEALLSFGKHTPVYINRKDEAFHPIVRTIHRLSELI